MRFDRKAFTEGFIDGVTAQPFWRWVKRLICRHDWRYQYKGLVLENGPNKGQICGTIVSGHCPKCDKKYLRIAV